MSMYHSLAAQGYWGLLSLKQIMHHLSLSLAIDIKAGIRKYANKMQKKLFFSWILLYRHLLVAGGSVNIFLINYSKTVSQVLVTR